MNGIQSELLEGLKKSCGKDTFQDKNKVVYKFETKSSDFRTHFQTGPLIINVPLKSTNPYPGRLSHVYGMWTDFANGRSISASPYLPKVILKTWQHYCSYKVDPFIRLAGALLKGKILKDVPDKNQIFITMSKPFM